MKLSPDQKKYIRSNHGRLPPKAMARQLGIEVKFVRKGMRELGLSLGDEKEAASNLRASKRFLRNQKLSKIIDALKSPKLAWPLLLFLAFALRLIHLLEVDDTPFFLQLHNDSAVYHHWAMLISLGDWLGTSYPVFYQGPGYAYFLASIYTVFGEAPWWACMIQVILGTLSVGLTYELGRRLFGPATGLIAGLLAACYPMFIFTNALLLGVTLIVFLNLLMLILIASAMPRPSWWKWLAAGLLLGLSALLRGNILIFGPLAVIAVIAYYGWDNKRRWLSAGLLMFFGCLLALAPATAHNFLIGEDHVLLTANAGANFYIGNNPDSDGIYIAEARYKGRPMGMSVRDQEANFPAVARKELKQKKVKPSRVSSFWMGKTFDSIKEKPKRWLMVISKKLKYFFNSYEVPNNRDLEFSKRFSLILSMPWPSFGIIMPLGLLGLALMVRRFRKRGLLLMYFAAYLFALLAFFVNARYRLPLVPVLLITAAVSLRWLWRVLQDRRWLPAIMAVLSLAGLYFLAYQPVDEVGFRTNHLNLGNAYRDLGNNNKALESYDEAIRMSPGYYYGHFKKGEVLGRMGKRKEAIASLAHALDLARRRKDGVNARRIVLALGKLGVKTQVVDKLPEQPKKNTIRIPAPPRTSPRP
ncbi:MAG: glycosyltransferase family 39 protein [Deltaproteobacteria bacterium]|nr:glycosyltransferase family 39 protein [Deltaproteobacteria bacterium]